MTIELKTFLLGPLPKNTQLSIEEMDSNFLNLKSGIEAVELNLTNTISSAITLEQNARSLADTAENAARIAADVALDSRVTYIETSYLKKDGSIPMTGILNAGGYKISSVARATDSQDAANKKYVDNEAPYYASTQELTSNLTLTSVNFPDAANVLYFLPSSAISAKTLTLPSPSDVRVGTKIHIANWNTVAGRNVTVGSTTNSIRNETGTFSTTQVIYSYGKLTLVSDGQYWIMLRQVHRPITNNMWNDGVVSIRNSGDSYLGKAFHLKSTSDNGYNPSAVEFSVQTTGTQLKVFPDASGVSTALLTIDRSTGKVFQDTNAPITDANQLVTRDYLDKNVLAYVGVINKVITIANIQTSKEVSKPFYASLTASDFGNVVRYRMESRGNTYTSLPDISTLGSNKRISLVNISNDTLPANNGIVPAYAPFATVTIFPAGTNKIIGQAGSVFSSNGALTLAAGDMAELVAISGNEWMLVSHSSPLDNGRDRIQPHNRLMIICKVKYDGTIYTTTVASSTRSYLWTKPNVLYGNESGIIVNTVRNSVGVYTISWLNPNCWENGQTYIVTPTANVTVNYAGLDANNTSYTTKIENLDAAANSCKVSIKDHNNNFVDASFNIVVYGDDV